MPSVVVQFGHEIEKEILNNPEIQGEEWYWDTITTSPTHMKLVRSIDWNDSNGH